MPGLPPGWFLLENRLLFQYVTLIRCRQFQHPRNIAKEKLKLWFSHLSMPVSDMGSSLRFNYMQNLYWRLIPHYYALYVTWMNAGANWSRGKSMRCKQVIHGRSLSPCSWSWVVILMFISGNNGSCVQCVQCRVNAGGRSCGLCEFTGHLNYTSHLSPSSSQFPGYLLVSPNLS